MEIRSSIPTSLPANETAPASKATADDPRVSEAQRITPPREAQGENREDKTRREAEAPKRPIITGTRLELRVDEGTKEVFGRVVNRETGEAVREIPAKELRRLEAKTIELLGAIVDKTA